METVPALEVNNLSVKIAGHTIVNSINFSTAAGTTTAIIGPNGAGKSILLKAILRLVPKQKGEVRVFGQEHENYRRIAPLISYIPQSLQFERGFPLTVRGLFSLKSPHLLGMNKEEKGRMLHLLDHVGATNLVNRRLDVLSGGQLQRVLLANSLMDKPKILFLDEPAAGIDAQGQETIYPLLDRIQREEHIALVLVSHELQIVMQYADQVLCLNREIICSGIPKKVLTNETLQRMYGTPVGHFTHSHS